MIVRAEASGNWDEVADWCEAYDWSEAQEIPVAEFYLGSAAKVRPVNEPQLLEAISAARANGSSWDRISEILGLSAQEARERYGHLLDAPARRETPSALQEAEDNMTAVPISTDQ